MPNIITHKIFAEEVLNKITKTDIRKIIEQHLQIYYIGSNGPDYLFFYHAKPWEVLKDHEPNKIGSELHKKGVNAFYESSIHSIRKESSKTVKEDMMAYIFGHLCHWALDMMTHPYIFYRTGDCQGLSASYHHRFESMMDTLMLEKFHNKDIHEYPFYEICTYDEEMLKAIARIYVPAVQAALDKELKVYDIRVSLNEWKDIQKLLYDPHNRKTPILKAVEKVAKKPWFISGNVVPKEKDEQFDILNLEKNIWLHPCDNQVSQDASFLELFDDAVELAVTLIECMYGCIEYHAPEENVLSLLQDRAYDTGMSGETNMQHFSIIYEEE